MIAFFGYGPFCLLTMFFLGFFYYERALLITDGVVDRGIVVSYDPSSCGSLRSPRTCHYHQISVPNLGSISLDLGSEFKLSSPVVVTYQKSDKSNVRAGNVTSLASFNFFQWFGFIVFIVCFWIFVLLSKRFINALNGKPLD
jgi:hypothetical protein